MIPGDIAFHAFLYSNGVMRDLGNLGGIINSFAYAINNLGQIVGDAQFTAGGELTAFLYSDGVLRNLGALGGTTSHASALNDSGQVVGYANTASGAQRAFLYSDGVMIDLNSLLPPGSGWDLRQATGINDSGQIVGVGRINGQMHGFLLSPIKPESVPEPGTLILLATAIGGLLAFSRRRRLAMRG